jgi:hypothetical protein
VQDLIVVPTGQNCPTDPSQLVGGRDDHHISLFIQACVTSPHGMALDVSEEIEDNI